MKNNFTSISRLLPLFILLFGSMNSFAQPANDNCDSPTPITLAADQASCVWVDGDTRMAQDATVLTNAPGVCSGSWYIDDVWFSFSTGATIPSGGIVIQSEFGSQPDDIAGIGMSFYTNSCDTDNLEFQCFSNGDGTVTGMTIVCDLEPNTSYLVRAWSGGNTTATEGTFRICAYAAPDLPVENVVVIEEFDISSGFGDWTTVANVPDSIFDIWDWDENGIFPTGGGATTRIPTGYSACNPAFGFPARFYQTNRTGDNGQIAASAANYEEYNSELVSPPIDLSGVTSGVSLKFDQFFRRLNDNVGNPEFASVQYSIDDGATWSDPIEINADMAANDAARESTERVGLPGAQGNANVRVKFVFQGDFYFWLVSRIQIIEREAHNLRANPFYSIAPSLLTPEFLTDSIMFLVDVENIGAQDQDGVNVNINIVNSANDEVYNDDLAYGTVASGFVDENRIFPESFVPPTGAIDTYTATYTVSADSTDFDLSNNSQSFTFFTTDSVFAKEDNVGIFGVTSPAATTELTWTMASTYFVKNGEDAVDPNIKYECTSVLIGLDNLIANIGGFVTIYLYEWEDVNLDGIAQNTERNGSTGGDVLGNLTYEIEDGTADALDLLVSLENFNNSGEPLQLKANTTYVLAAGLTSAGVSKIQTTGNNENDYGATNFLTDSIAVERISCMWNTTSDDGGLNSDLEQVIFNPRMRMHVNKFAEVSLNSPLDIANKVNVYPNPATEVVNMELDLVENLNNAIVRIVDLNARNVMEVTYDNLSSQTLTYSVANLAAGTYFLKIQSDKGYITKKFTVAK